MATPRSKRKRTKRRAPIEMNVVDDESSLMAGMESESCIEVRLVESSTIRHDQIKDCILDILATTKPSQFSNRDVTDSLKASHELLRDNVDKALMCYGGIRGGGGDDPDETLVHWVVYVYQVHEEDAEPGETLESDNTASAAYHQWTLPSQELEGVWESLIFEGNIKDDMLSYVQSTLLFSDVAVDPSLVSWNRVALFHGPPGTGKTSLCRALSQKLSIRLSGRFVFGQLIELNSHSLFSKWFSESGKLVTKLFSVVEEMLLDPDCFVCLLIDEVESLSATRRAALSGVEPSDGIRVVNAFLTQIDRLKKYKNLLILTTSNITDAIDLAFVDRADIKQYIGPPAHQARYSILASCVTELMRTGIISPKAHILDFKSIELLDTVATDNEGTNGSRLLYTVAAKAEGLTGRALRKLPLLAHAKFVRNRCTSWTNFVAALELAVNFELECRRDCPVEDLTCGGSQ